MSHETVVCCVGGYGSCLAKHAPHCPGERASFQTKAKALRGRVKGFDGVTEAFAIVVDDPMAAFKVAVTAANSTMSSAARAAVGANMSVLVGTGDTATGNSGASVLAGSEATTAGLVVRVIDTVDETKTAADTFVELIVKINLHQYNNTTGV